MRHLLWLCLMAGCVLREDVSYGDAASAQAPVTASCHEGDLVVGDREVLVRCVRGDVILRHTAREDLSVLSGVESISGALHLEDNSRLESLRGLHPEVRVDALVVRGNQRLRTLRGLPKWERLERIEVVRNARLRGLRGLEHVRSAGRVWLRANPHLRTLAGLRRLEHVDVTFEIEDHDALVDLRGLERLGVVGARLSQVEGPGAGGAAYALRIVGNVGLESTSGLHRLRRVHGDLEVGENPNLTSLFGLEAVFEVGGSVHIHANPRLAKIGLEGLSHVGVSVAFEELAITDVARATPVLIGARHGTGGRVVFRDLPRLRRGRGLSKWVFVGQGELEVRGCEQLLGLPEIDPNLTALRVERAAALRSLGRLGERVHSIRFERTGLEDLSALRDVTALSRLDLLDNNALRSLAGLESLESADALVLEGNVALEDWSALRGLTRIGSPWESGRLRLADHPRISGWELGSLEALDGVLEVVDNPHVDVCEASRLALDLRAQEVMIRPVPRSCAD